MARIASWALAASQNMPGTRSEADFRRVERKMLMTVQYHDIADIATRVSSTTQETAKSPGLEVIS